MNLTSKRMLQFLTVCAGACALTASAQTTWVSDNFEADVGNGYSNGVPGMAAATYKMAVWGSQNEYTNLSWFATSGDDASVITNIDNSSYALDSRPITGSATANILQLNTEGQTLSRYAKLAVTNTETGQMGPESIDFGVVGPNYSDKVYVDTLIQFTPSEDAPTIETGVKIAVWVDVNSNLVVRHQKAGVGPTNSVFTTLGTINPADWHRLTIELGLPPGMYDPAAQIWLDGTLLQHDNGYTTTPSSPGPYFMTLDSDQTFTQVSFQGTGAVDELVITDTLPTHNTTGLLLTLAFNDALLDVFVDSAAVTNGEQIASGSAVTMYTIDWYQLNSITGTGITTNVTDGNIGGNMSTNAVVEITADEAGRTATINVGQFTGSIPTSVPGYEAVPADKLSAWAVDSQLSIADVLANADDYLDNYLLNVDESTAATLKITSIVYDGTKATITVEATDDSETDAVDFTDLNGTLLVWTTDDLAGGWGEPEDYTVGTPTSTSVSIEVPNLNGKFIKARVE